MKRRAPGFAGDIRCGIIPSPASFRRLEFAWYYREPKRGFMRKLLITLFSVMCVAFAAGQSFAQGKIAPQKEALIKEFLGLMGGKESIEKMSSLMMRLQQAESQKMVAAMINDDKGLTTTEKEELKQFISESTDRVMKRIDDFFSK